MNVKTAILLCLSTAAVPAFANTIALWTFEVNTPADLSDSATISGVAADVGSGIASGSHLSALSDWTTPAGNGSQNSLNANYWAMNDYFQFRVSTFGYDSISICWDQASSNTGPGTFGLFYSIDGGLFTQFGSDYSVLANASPNPTWNSSTASSNYGFTADFSSLGAMNNAASVVFRLVDANSTSANGGTVGSTGTDRVDNFKVTGSKVPVSLPTGFGAMVLAGVVLCSRRFVRGIA